eukprot:6265848-Alexandrium_andersonii.AAC.1
MSQMTFAALVGLADFDAVLEEGLSVIHLLGRFVVVVEDAQLHNLACLLHLHFTSLPQQNGGAVSVTY